MNFKWNPELFTIRLSAGDGAAARTGKSAHGSGGAASGTAREPQTPGAQAQTGVLPRRPLASTIAGSWYPSDPEKGAGRNAPGGVEKCSCKKNHNSLPDACRVQ